MRPSIDEILSYIDKYISEEIDAKELDSFIDKNRRDNKDDELFKHLEYISYHSPILEQAIEYNEGFVLLRSMIGLERDESKVLDIVRQFIEIG